MDVELLVLVVAEFEVLVAAFVVLVVESGMGVKLFEEHKTDHDYLGNIVLEWAEVGTCS